MLISPRSLGSSPLVGAMAQVFLVLAVVLSCLAVSVQGFNITAILDAYPNFSVFNRYLTETGVAKEVNARTTITVLVSSNTAFQAYVNGAQSQLAANPDTIADTLRYQVLLTYLTWTQLEQIVVGNYSTVTTLLQTTGRTNDTGFVDIYNTGKQILIGHHVVDSYGNRTVTGNVTFHAYDYSILQISSVLIPLPSFLPAPLPAPTISPAPSEVAPAASIPTRTTPTTAVPPSYASMTRVSFSLALTTLFVASIGVIL